MSSSHGKVKLNTERLPEINETAIRMAMPTKMKQAEQGSECTLDLETNAPSVVSLSRLYLLLQFICYSQDTLKFYLSLKTLIPTDTLHYKIH